MRLLLLLALTLSGCTPYLSGALMVHDKAIDAPEITLENPIAEIELGVSNNNIDVFVRHASGVFETEYGYGFNAIGVRYTIK